MSTLCLGPLIIFAGVRQRAYACLRVCTLKSLPHSNPAAPEREQQPCAPMPAAASSASKATCPAIILADADSVAFKSPLPIATTTRNHAQTIALDTSLPPEARAALAEDLLAGLVSALARVAVEMQTSPSPPLSEPKL